MRDYGSHMTLGSLVQLTSQFLAAVQGKLEEQGCKTVLRDNLNSDQSGQMRELVEDWGTLNARVDQVIKSGIDLHRMDILADQINAVSLQIHDILLGNAVKILGKAYVTFLVPDGLRSVSANDLLARNNAKAISNLTKNILQ